MSEAENNQTVEPKVKDEKSKRERKQNRKQSTQTVEPKSAAFPVEEFINPWGFIRLNRNVLEAFGVNHTSDVKKPYEKTNITIDLQEGALVVKKA